MALALYFIKKTDESNNLVEPSGLEFILKDEPVNPQANPALAKLEAGVEGTFQLLQFE